MEITAWTWMCVLHLILLNRCRAVHRVVAEDLELYEGSRCRLGGDGAEQGVCVKLINCPVRVQQVRAGNFNEGGRCGFSSFHEIVCCRELSSEQLKEQSRPAEAACREFRRTLNVDGPPATSVMPYMVALSFSSPKDEDASGMIRYACGGALISHMHILTAAHCVTTNIDGFKPVQVLLGSMDLSKQNQNIIVPIARIIKHPRYDESSNHNDIAIIELQNPVEFTSSVQPVCLLTKPLSNLVSESANFIMLGWVSTFVGGSTHTRLMKAEHLHLVGGKDCSESYSDLRVQIHPIESNDTVICVWDPSIGRRADTCWDNTGGVLLISSREFLFLAGVTAFGQTCGGSRPSVYTSVFEHLTWIEDQVWQRRDF
ncbi:venom protease-like [Neodiprion pinetum]|uniref:venom protease-like n=1 Tax=Neodiprion pinetum TaxID=441929 RepID=UPI001EDCF4C9|nr:venom protease-like isoform X1 [Neodiprion pinetum]